jgi:hypothetical protein
MTALEWDKTGEKIFETGIDHGVLYPPEGPAVPWNGLSSVTENITREVKSYFIDGVQYLAHHVPGSYVAKVQAFTYPDELDEMIGIVPYSVAGVYLHDQRAKMFNLSYRTKIGNDVGGMDVGYKIHVLFNVLATPSDRTYDSLSDDVSLSPFEWNLTGVPSLMMGEMRPTSHITLDSRTINPELMSTLAGTLYGDEFGDASLPSAVDFLNYISFWDPDVIVS